MIIALEKLNAEDAALFGSKAAFMGTLTGKRIKTPAGFALSVEFFDAFLAYNDIPFHPQEFRSLNGRLRRSILEGSFPKARENILYRLHERLSARGKELIVRSSALCEERAELCFSGLFASVPGVRTADELINAIKQCYASLLNKKTLGYAQENGVAFEELKMGIIIQEYVQGKPSGVIFSADPEQLDSHALVIRWVDGPSNDFINGTLNRRHLLLPRKGEITRNGGFAAGQLAQLRKLGLKSERLMGDGQDIEWTFDASDLYVLQGKPRIKESSD